MNTIEGLGNTTKNLLNKVSKAIGKVFTSNQSLSTSAMMAGARVVWHGDRAYNLDDPNQNAKYIREVNASITRAKAKERIRKMCEVTYTMARQVANKENEKNLIKYGFTRADLVQRTDTEQEIFRKYYQFAKLGLHPHTGRLITEKEQWQFKYDATVGTASDMIGLVGGAYAGQVATNKGIGKGTNTIANTLDDLDDATTSKKASYNVDPSMQAKDIEMGVLRDGVYIKNPTAQNINDLVKPNSNYLGSKQMNGQYMYVVDLDGNIIIGTRAGQHMPHPTLVGGTNPTVQGAGILDIRGGKIYSIDNGSGHLKPDLSSLKNVEKAFGNLPSNIYHKDFKGFLEYK